MDLKQEDRGSESPVSRVSHYELEAIVGRLFQQGDTDVLHHLLALERRDGRNAWFVEKLSRLGSLQSYLDDIWTARTAAERATRACIQARGHGVELAMVCQYAMIESTLTGFAKGFSPGFAAAAVRERTMAPQQAREYLALQDDALQEAVGVAAILGQLGREAAPMARSIGDKLRAFQRRSFYDGLRLRQMTWEVEHELGEVGLEELEQLGWPPVYAYEFSPRHREHVRIVERFIHWNPPAFLRLELALFKALGSKTLECVRRAQLVAQLPEHRREAVVREIWPSIPSIGERARGSVLRLLAPDLPDDLMSEALDLARRIERLGTRSLTLGTLLPQASREAIERQVKAITVIHDDDDRAAAMTSFALGLGETGSWLEALHTVGIIQDTSLQDKTLLALGDLGWRKSGHLDAAVPRWKKYEAGTEEEKTRWVCRTAYMEMVRRIAESEGPPIGIVDALESAARLGVRKASRLYPTDDGETATRQDLIMKARMARQEAEQIQLCSAVLLQSSRVFGWYGSELQPLLPDEILESMLGSSYRLSKNEIRAKKLESLVGAVARLQISWVREEILARLISRLVELGFGDKAVALLEAVDLSDSMQDQLVKRVYNVLVTNGQLGAANVVAESMDSSLERDERLRLMALRAADLGHGQGALEAASSVSDWGDRDRTLQQLVPKLCESGLHDVAILAVRRIARPALRREALVALAPGLPLHLQPQALRLAREVKDTKMRNITLVMLISEFGQLWTRKKSEELPPPVRQQVVAQAIGMWENGALDEDRVIPVIALINLGQFGDALEKAKRILEKWRKGGWGYSTIKFFEKLLPHVPEEYFDEVLEVIRSIGDRSTMMRAMTRGAQQLACQGYSSEALALAKEFRRVTIGGSSPRGEIYLAIVPYLPETPKLEVLKDLPGWWDGLAPALCSIAPYLTTETLASAALEAASRIADHAKRVETVSALAEHFPRSQRERAIEEAFDLAQNIYRVNERTQAYWAIAPQLSLPQWSKVLTDAQEVEEFSDAVEMLRTLAHSRGQFPGAGLYEVWEAIFSWLRSRSRAELLLGLGALSPVMVALGGPEAVVDTARAVQDVGRWWP